MSTPSVPRESPPSGGELVRALRLDVTDEDSVVAAFDAVGEFDTVVNCAGLSDPGA